MAGQDFVRKISRGFLWVQRSHEADISSNLRIFKYYFQRGGVAAGSYAILFFRDFVQVKKICGNYHEGLQR
jgi:hypothetical protein